MLSVLTRAVHRRRSSVLWWSLGMAGMCALLAVAYPTVRDNNELDKTFANLPPGVEALLGLAGGNTLTSPAGYLDSQLFANVLPLVLLVFGVGMAAWTVAGDEAAGTLELLLANPVSRVRVALARLGALVALLGVLGLVCLVALLALAPPTGMSAGLSAGHLAAATLGAVLLGLTFAAVAFAVGAATGSRPAALAIASALAVAGYVLEGLAGQVHALQPTRVANPWHWLLASDPLRHGLTWQTWFPPVLVTVVLVAIGLPRLARRDLG
jgi:beta-exotoxin I transport system permease protein